MAPNKANH